ncbi:hypothetical protein V8C42DRAFT_321022, partial [Trichoderma barbatum]
MPLCAQSRAESKGQADGPNKPRQNAVVRADFTPPSHCVLLLIAFALNRRPRTRNSASPPCPDQVVTGRQRLHGSTVEIVASVTPTRPQSEM